MPQPCVWASCADASVFSSAGLLGSIKTGGAKTVAVADIAVNAAPAGRRGAAAFGFGALRTGAKAREADQPLGYRENS